MLFSFTKLLIMIMTKLSNYVMKVLNVADDSLPTMIATSILSLKESDADVDSGFSFTELVNEPLRFKIVANEQDQRRLL